MLIEQTLEKLTLMRLHGMRKSIEEKINKVGHEELSFADLFGLIVDEEWMYRENRKMSARFRNAKFKERNACIENIKFRADRGIKKAQILDLAQNRFISAHQNITITGPSGAGKSYLGQAFGNGAIRSGFSVHYIRVPKLCFAFVEAKAEGTYGDLLKRLGKINVLILDDFGLAPLTEAEKQDLIEVAEERYGVGSTIITSQLPTGTWHEYLGGGRIADALLDRWLHNAHRLEVKSIDSLRKEMSGLTDAGQSEKK
jgi:DNA replication protein DnaC